jgi:16S rRNA (cytosine967-C5)-methyltransferase
MDNARKISVDILQSIFDKGGYSNIVLNKSLSKANLESRDKGLVTEIVYGTIKYKYTIDKILSKFLKNGLKKQDSFLLNILRITIYQIKYLEKIPEFAAVNEAVELTKKYRSLSSSKVVNGVLRNYLRSDDSSYIIGNNNLETLCFNYSFEMWMVKLLIKQYGMVTAEKIMDGLNKVPSITLRVNNIKTNYENAVKDLTSYGYEIEEGSICPEAIRIIKGRSIEDNPLFLSGMATVQDESAMLVAPLMSLKENMTVLDLCSAPGGKTTHISEIMNNTGRVFAFDIHKDKLALIMQNTKRLGITNIKCSALDAAVYDNALKDLGDRVLIDVPCSGLGIIRKKPEIKWTKNEAELNNLIDIQRKIMKNAALYVKIGGYIIYSTCTLNKKENEENIKWFLSSNKNFTIERIFFGNAENICYSDFGVTILPDENMDGFFIAKLHKTE